MAGIEIKRRENAFLPILQQLDKWVTEKQKEKYSDILVNKLNSLDKQGTVEEVTKEQKRLTDEISNDPNYPSEYKLSHIKEIIQHANVLQTDIKYKYIYDKQLEQDRKIAIRENDTKQLTKNLRDDPSFYGYGGKIVTGNQLFEKVTVGITDPEMQYRAFEEAVNNHKLTAIPVKTNDGVVLGHQDKNGEIYIESDAPKGVFNGDTIEFNKQGDKEAIILPNIYKKNNTPGTIPDYDFGQGFGQMNGNVDFSKSGKDNGKEVSLPLGQWIDTSGKYNPEKSELNSGITFYKNTITTNNNGKIGTYFIPPLGKVSDQRGTVIYNNLKYLKNGIYGILKAQISNGYAQARANKRLGGFQPRDYFYNLVRTYIPQNEWKNIQDIGAFERFIMSDKFDINNIDVKQIHTGDEKMDMFLTNLVSTYKTIKSIYDRNK